MNAKDYNRQASDVAHELHRLACGSNVLRAQHPISMVTGVFLYGLSLSRTLAVPHVALHELIDMLDHDFPDASANTDSVVLAEMLAALLGLKVGGHPKPTPKPKEEIEKAVRDADAEADRIIAAATGARTRRRPSKGPDAPKE